MTSVCFAFFFRRVLNIMIIGFLQNPHAFALAIAISTAILSFLYAKTTETSDPKAPAKVFWKTLAAAVISALVLTWIVYRPEHISREPFSADTVASYGVPQPGPTTMSREMA
jgi:multisubunit Na+/H+ antiporter MnhC subunit